MKKLFYILFVPMLFLFSAGCEKSTFDNTSLIDSDKAPQNISALFEITQDNSGLVTITPNGEGAVYYDVYFGDTTRNPSRVMAGKSITHKYPEGNYNVRLVAYSLTGKTAEATKTLTVTFRTPENLQINVSIDPANNFKVNVSATALYETFFRVYFREVPNEVPVSFLEGQTASHTYSTTGSFMVKVVAYSGGAATRADSQLVTIVNPLLLPITFESPTVQYTFNNFDGGNASKVANPVAGGINTTANVGRMIKGAGQVWGGSWIGLSSPIDFSTNKIFRMKVHAPRAGARVLLKVENASNPGLNFEKEDTITTANTWEDLVFDFSSINTANAYHHIVLIFDLGIVGDGSSNFTYYFDDIRLTNTLPSVPTVSLPLTLENTSLNYNITNFDGGILSVIANPQINGINTSSRVLKMVKNAGQPWGGSFITLDAPISFPANPHMKLKVYSPRVGAKVLLKVENLTNGGISFEKEVLTTVANQWEELVFDYTTINTAQSYQKIVLIFDNGTVGDGSPNYTFLVDDISVY